MRHFTAVDRKVSLFNERIGFLQCFSSLDGIALERIAIGSPQVAASHVLIDGCQVLGIGCLKNARECALVPLHGFRAVDAKERRVDEPVGNALCGARLFTGIIAIGGNKADAGDFLVGLFKLGGEISL